MQLALNRCLIRYSLTRSRAKANGSLRAMVSLLTPFNYWASPGVVADRLREFSPLH